MAATTGNEAIGLYSARTAARIARIRPQNFQAWAKANLVQPTKIALGKRFENVYGYDDLLLIRLIVRLKEQGAKTRHIKKALDTIAYMNSGDRNAWKKARIMVSDGFVVVVFPDREDWNPIAASEGPQKMAEVFFPALIKDLQNDLVPQDRFKYIEINPEVLGGSPVIKGTRLSTRAVLSVIESGGDPKVVYPNLTDEQIEEARDYEKSFLQAA